MANNQQQFDPFWDWVNRQNTQNHGAGVDHQVNANAFPFSFFGPPPPPPPGTQGPEGRSFPHGPPGGSGGWPFGAPGHHGGRHFGGRGGRRGRCHRRDSSHERSSSHEGPSDNEHPEGEHREGSPHTHGHHNPGGRHGGRHGRHGRGGGRARGFPGGGPGGFDLTALFESLSAHPLAEAFRNYAQQAAAAGQRSAETLVPQNDDDSFMPPVDLFNTTSAYILHVSLPGAKKEDVGVNWDAEKSVLNLAGVVYRQGDEELLKTLSQSERKVGVFERTVKLPPGTDDKEEIDGDAISAKLEDGVLIVTVPKLEKEWTEVKRVDIE